MQEGMRKMPHVSGTCTHAMTIQHACLEANPSLPLPWQLLTCALTKMPDARMQARGRTQT